MVNLCRTALFLSTRVQVKYDKAITKLKDDSFMSMVKIIPLLMRYWYFSQDL